MEGWLVGSETNPNPVKAPAYTASPDAAMTLVPEGWVVGKMSWWPPAKSATAHMDNMHGLTACSGAVSLPLALTAAALRALATKEPSS